MQPRPYQIELLRATAKDIAHNTRVIMQLPTGGGKTFVFSEIIRRYLDRSMFNRVLVLTHRVELFGQTLSAVVRTGTDVTELKAGQPTGTQHSETRCLIAMVETLKRRHLPDFGRFSLVIVDEAHRADFSDIIRAYPDSYIIGATATPLTASKKYPLKDLYDSIVTGPSINELIESGYLASPVHYKAAFDDSHLRKRAGEYTPESQFESMSNHVHYENLVQLWQNHAGGKKTIVFNINQQHTREVDAMFRRQGVASTAILSGDSDRDTKIAKFRAGEIRILNNCEIFTAGFDLPDIECVVLNRATASLPLYLQMIGRGGRVAPGKSEFTILDFGGNIDRHGLWNLDRDWEQIFRNPKKATDDVAPHKECEKCGALVLSVMRVCDYCGFEFPSPEEVERKAVQGYLEKVGSAHVEGKHIDDLSITELYHLELAGRYKPSYIARIARTRGELSEYARLKGYNAGWVHFQKSLGKGYSNNRVTL